MKYSKLYVLAPYKYATGGVELCHQLVDSLREKKQNAYIVYEKDGKIVNDSTVTTEYQMYNVVTSATIEDNSNNILVLPEIYLDWTLKYKNINIACWWTSVDNYYRYCCFIDRFRFSHDLYSKFKLTVKYILGRIKKSPISISILRQFDDKIFHLYQSHYAQFHLYNLGFSKVLPLSDYINNTYVYNNINNNKEDIILYNPKKGYNITKKIIKRMSGYKFIPLINLSRKELVSLMQRAKLYIDFGHFPGKDRLPREAVINGCCIITSTLGAAYYYEDIPINKKYKFKVSNKNINSICNSIEYIINNYDKVTEEFEFMRKKIKDEEKIFRNEINDFFL